MENSSSPPDSGRTARLTLNLAALALNWCAVASRAAPAETAAVIKADGYGTGLAPAVRALLAAGCKTFFVARAEEGVAAREIAPEAIIYVLDGAVPETLEMLGANNLRPVLSSRAEVENYAGVDAGPGKPPSAIHVDTGLNRLGLTLEEARVLAQEPRLLAGARPLLLMSHLACSDQKTHPKNAAQLELFREVLGLFPGMAASLANSGGVYLGRDYHFDLVRPGMALYGGDFAEGLSPLHNVVTAEARILQIKEARAGESVGYGASERLARPSRLAILGVGYADGYPRHASSSDTAKGGRVFIRGRLAPLVGRVSMDLMAADVTDIPSAQVGVYAELFGPNLPLEEAANRAGTIGYELLTHLGPRYARKYVG